MCAIEAGKRGRTVMIIDHANKAGKKILMSGGGRCNFTNTNVSHENFLSQNAQFCRSALSRYTSEHFLELVKKHNIPFHEKTLGQLFCDNKSKDILNMLLKECEEASVTIQLNTNIKKITHPSDTTFVIDTTSGSITCQSLVIATGGLSIPTLGASPFGYRIAEQFGINVCPTRAGLVPFTLHVHDKEKLASLSGIALDCTVSCNKTSFRENMLFTHRGLSGPAMLQISSYWQPGDTLTVDLLPDINLAQQLTSAKHQHGHMMLKNYLSQYLPKRLVTTWLDDTLAYQKITSCTPQTLKDVAHSLQHWQIKPNSTEGYRTAEVTLGGVDCNAISSKTFQVNQVPGLYFIGEVLDVSGWLGGYNFQWAWASGVAAGCVV